MDLGMNPHNYPRLSMLTFMHPTRKRKIDAILVKQKKPNFGVAYSPAHVGRGLS
jgi:hypothetical protein